MTLLEIKTKIKKFLKTKRKVGYSIAEISTYFVYAVAVLAFVLMRHCGGRNDDIVEDSFGDVMDAAEYAEHYEEHIISFLDKYKAPRASTEFVTIHHSGASGNATAEDVQQYHIPLYGDIAYHYLYYPGKKKVVQVRGLDEGSPHAYSMNFNSVAICIMGDFEKEELDSVDIVILRTLITQLRDIYALGPECVVGHGDCVAYNPRNNTACPGCHVKTRMFVPAITEDDYERMISDYERKTRNSFTEFRRTKMTKELVSLQYNKAQFDVYIDKEYADMVTTIKNKKK